MTCYRFLNLKLRKFIFNNLRQTMLNVERIEGGQITGLDGDDIDFICNDLLTLDDSSIFNQFTGLQFDQETTITDLDSLNLVPLSDEQFKEIEMIEQEAKNRSTGDQTRIHVKKFVDFLSEQNLPQHIDQMPVRYLVSYLRLWFSKLVKNDGQPYSPNSLCCIRASIHRYLVEKRNMNLIGNSDFLAFDKTYKAMITKSLKEKKCSVLAGDSGYSAIEQKDLKRLSNILTEVLLRNYKTKFFL